MDRIAKRMMRVIANIRRKSATNTVRAYENARNSKPPRYKNAVATIKSEPMAVALTIWIASSAKENSPRSRYRLQYLRLSRRMMMTKGSKAAYGAKRALHADPIHPGVANTGALSRSMNATINETAATAESVSTSATFSVGITQRGARAGARTAVA